MKICKNFKDRCLGLMFKKHIEEEYLFPNCKSIHTFFMKINIDVMALDNNNKIIKIYRNVQPNKIILAPKKTYSILEAQANSSYEVGNKVI